MDEEPELWEPLVKYLAMHPGYYAIFQESTSQLFYRDGPLPLSHRHFVAMMGAARHQCQFLLDVHKREFLRLGGDLRWLEGIDRCSTKISRLDTVSRLLAHRPWLIQPSHLEELSRRPNPDNWSLSELMQGAIILSHIHSLCSFIKGCGILSSQPSSPAVGNNGEVESLMARMHELSQSSSQSSQEDKARQFADIYLENCKLSLGNGAVVCGEEGDYAQFTKDLSFQYTDFIKRNGGPSSQGQVSCAPTFKIHDYSWEDQGYSLVSQLYSQLSNLLDGKFRFTQTLTYHTMGGHENVDTSLYRMAIWNYIQSLYGIRHDDYDYADVNHMLSRNMKTFIKTLCCYPEKTTDALRNSVMTEFLLSEKVHVLLIILEAKQQAELLYFLRAVERYTTSTEEISPRE